MGTRADFYVGRGKDAEWLGSIAWDGYWTGIDATITQATSETKFRAAVEAFISGREDGTKPSEGWPWPWADSGTTDCAYAFDCGKVWQEFNRHWIDGSTDIPKGMECAPENSMPVDWPDMKGRKNIQWGAKSGLIIVGTRERGSTNG